MSYEIDCNDLTENENNGLVAISCFFVSDKYC